MADKLMWEVVEDGYVRTLRYVSYPQGRVVGRVTGFNNDANKEWSASISDLAQPNIGSYVNEALAKNAVEETVAKMIKLNKPKPKRRTTFSSKDTLLK